jgi:hypothetical protein
LHCPQKIKICRREGDVSRTLGRNWMVMSSWNVE